jgi:hypothetical protein
MPSQPKCFFDTFTGAEADLMEAIMAEVKDAPWAQPLLKEIKQNGGLCGANMARFFELRQGHALHKAGITPRYEVPGEGQSTLDFGFTSGGRSWNVEMMRLTETDAAKAATETGVDEDGMAWRKRILSSGNPDPKQSPEGETLKAIQRLCQKCEKDGQPYKFKPPGSSLNALIVDMRTFSTRGGDNADRIHIGLGGSWLPEHFRMYWGEGKDRQLITGVFSPHTNVKGAAEARDRLHFIGFVNEKSFGQGDYEKSIQFVANPHLFKNVREMKAAIDTWPLASRSVLNGAP